jgi:carboxyl-terminal processing protease
MALLPLVAFLAMGIHPPRQAQIDYPAAWGQVQNAIQSTFYARETRKGEMESLFARFAPRARSAHSKDEFDRVVNEMIAAFGDSHFGFFTDDDQPYYLMDGLARPDSAAQMPNIGAWFRKNNLPGYEVQMVLESSPADKAGLRKGDQIVAADGRPFGPVTSFRDKEGHTVVLTVRRPGANEMTISVEPTKASAMDMFLDASKDSARVIEAGGKKIGYFHLWTQGSPKFSQALADAVYGKLSGTDAFILDLRDGFGGRPEGFGDPFFRPEATLEWKVAGGSGRKDLFGYGRPLVVLINHGSRSAKEVLSYLFKKSHRATLIGTNTAGNVLGTTPRRLSDWAYIEIPIVEVYADGIRLEKVGVAPDIKVEPESENGKDLVLSKALDFLTQTINRKAG